ncbi:MAG: pentapeptide repeat-containing protein [Rubrobacter sp.]|nr:pentapeptide repeat-containing protein [Rubrobacter sp.]
MTSDRTNSSESQPQRPPNDDPAAWHAYWKVLEQPWRTEPEIADKRKKELARRRAITPDPDRDEYPFQDMSLSRGDVEWLLKTHEGGLGPLKFLGEVSGRQEFNLQGANLSGVDLSYLPLTATRFEGAILTGANLEGAELQSAVLRDASLMDVNLKKPISGGLTWRVSGFGVPQP